MAIFLQQLITGLSIGGIYSLLAVGYALIYSIFDFTNFAFGSMMMIGAFACLFAISVLNVPIWLVIIICIVVTAILSVCVDTITYKPMRKKGSTKLTLMIAAMGVNIFIVNLMTLLLGGNIRQINYKFPIKTITIGSVNIGFIDILCLCSALIILLLLWWFLDRTIQ